ncbi:MAG: anti-sigma factor [Methylocella sp.]
MSEEREILAAEYVLGTLHVDERTLFASVLAHDEAARAAVAEWEKRLAPLSVAIADVAPPPVIWERIENALPPSQSRAFLAPSFAAIEGGLTERPTMAALRRSLNRWRGAALSVGAVAALLAIFVADRELFHHKSVLPSYVAVVNRGGDHPALIVRVDLGSGNVFVRPVAVEAPSGKSLELWYIDQGKAPKSMGVVAGDAIKMPLPAGLSLEKATFAVTVEPEGGSPTGDPTGPVIYSGQLIKE